MTKAEQLVATLCLPSFNPFNNSPVTAITSIVTRTTLPKTPDLRRNDMEL